MTIPIGTSCGCSVLMVEYRNEGSYLFAEGSCPHCGHTEFSGRFKVKCPFCGSLAVPEVDSSGTRYLCCGNEVPDLPSIGWLVSIDKKRRE